MDDKWPTFAQDTAPVLLQCVSEFMRLFNDEFVETIRGTVHYFSPPAEIASISEPLQALHEYLNTLSQGSGLINEFSVWKHQLPVLKRAIMLFRRGRAAHIERYKELTHNPDLLSRLEAELRPLDELINQQWFKETQLITLPSLTNYISMQHIESILRNKGVRIEERKHDEKFHILQAPQLFLRDLNYYRTICEIRGVPVVAAHIDIDNFKKKFNSKHGHTVIDRNVLPRFMACLESHIHSHGYSYRYGGDEYAMLIPSVSSSLAVLFLELISKPHTFSNR